MRRFALVSIAFHLLLALMLLLGAQRFGGGEPPPAQPEYATVELIQQDTPTVAEGGSSQPSKGEDKQPAPTPPAPPPKPPTEDAAKAEEAPAQPKAEEPQEKAPPTASPAKTPPPPPPEEASEPQPAPPPPPTEEAKEARPTPPSPPAPPPRPPASQLEVRLGDDETAGTGLVSGAGVIPASPDSNILNKPPPYPRDAVRRHEEGTVVIAIHVDPEGRPAEIEISKSSGHPALDLAAMDAVRKWHFRPAIENGHPVPSLFPFRVTFSLTDE